MKWRNGIPPPFSQRRNSDAAYGNKDFVSGKLKEVLSLGVIEECSREDLVCILPINVLPKPSGHGLRLIINGHALVPYEVQRKFKLEQIWKEGQEIFAGCTFGSIIDISSAYYHIDMAQESKRYIGFEWMGKFYWYNMLPMGIHSTPFIFTEVTKLMVRF
jgi:hypothetical protein